MNTLNPLMLALALSLLAHPACAQDPRPLPGIQMTAPTSSDLLFSDLQADQRRALRAEALAALGSQRQHLAELGSRYSTVGTLANEAPVQPLVAVPPAALPLLSRDVAAPARRAPREMSMPYFSFGRLLGRGSRTP